MQITEAWSKKLTPYMKSTDVAGQLDRAPLEVDVVFAAMIDPTDQIAASQVRYSYAKPARWSIWVVTSAMLAHVDMEYDEDCYNCREQEARQRDGSNYAAPKLNEAWARPLATINKLQFGGFSPDLQNLKIRDGVELSAVDLQVTFVDGEGRQTLPIGGNPPLRSEEDRKKWEDFVSAIRAGAPSPLTVEVVPSGRDG